MQTNIHAHSKINNKQSIESTKQHISCEERGIPQPLQQDYLNLSFDLQAEIYIPISCRRIIRTCSLNSLLSHCT